MIGLLKRLAKAIGFHVHEWGPWELVVMEPEDVVLTSGQACRLVGRRFRLRQCTTCGKYQNHYSKQETARMRREMETERFSRTLPHKCRRDRLTNSGPTTFAGHFDAGCSHADST